MAHQGYDLQLTRVRREGLAGEITFEGLAFAA